MNGIIKTWDMMVYYNRAWDNHDISEIIYDNMGYKQSYIIIQHGIIMIVNGI